MNAFPRRVCFATFTLLVALRPLVAQDAMHGAPEPIVASIDPAKLSYDFLVDGDLPADDPANKKFKTLQAAYEAAPAGTEDKPTVIGLRPNVYQLPGGAPRTPSMSIRKNYITFLGLTNNRRAVVLADNRGLMQGADDNGYILDVNATGFTLRNLTVLNYCNADYEYPGDAKKNLAKRSDVITQAVALQAAGDKHVYDNVALLGRLDTMFLRTTRSYFRHVYIEGTDDWMGGGQMSVWDDCTLVYSIGRGVMSASNIIFRRCRFEAARGMQFYKVEFRSAERPVALIDCIVPPDTVWCRGRAPARPNQYSLTYHVKYPDGTPTKIPDCTVGPPAFTYSRELSDSELLAYNPWNLLRSAANAVADDWDPAGEKSSAAANGNLVYRMTLAGGAPTIRTGGPGATLSATVIPTRANEQTITWSTKSDLVALSRTTGPNVVVTTRNTTDRAEWVAVDARAANGYFVTAYVYTEPKYIAPPAFAAKPTLGTPRDGTLSVDYQLDLGGREDQSLVTWSLCDDASGAHPRVIALSRGNHPLKTLTLPAGAVGKFIKAGVRPKHSISEPGFEVAAVTAEAIKATDVHTDAVTLDFRSFPTDATETSANGFWNTVGNWVVELRDTFATGYGLRPPTTGGQLLYASNAPTGDMQFDLTMTPEKTEGTGFSIPGSPADSGERNLHSDIFIKYDPHTRNGYSLRFWRTTQSAAKCMFQIYRIADGVGTPLDDKQVLSGVFKPTTRLTIKVTGPKLSVTASNDVDGDTLALEGTITPNRFGSAGVMWPRGSTNVYSRLEISYPKTPAAK